MFKGFLILLSICFLQINNYYHFFLVRKIGCFHHHPGVVPSPFPLYKNMRSLINWNDISEIVTMCADHVQDLGFKVSDQKILS